MKRGPQPKFAGVPMFSSSLFSPFKYHVLGHFQMSFHLVGDVYGIALKDTNSGKLFAAAWMSHIRRFFSFSALYRRLPPVGAA